MGTLVYLEEWLASLEEAHPGNEAIRKRVAEVRQAMNMHWEAPLSYVSPEQAEVGPRPDLGSC
jgi:hypothetical protein